MPVRPKVSSLTQTDTKNLILKKLPAEDFERLTNDAERVELKLGEVLYRAEQPIEYIYFPEQSMVSLVAMTVEGQTAEVGVVGREGVIGVDALLAGSTSIYENIVQHADGATRIKTDALKAEFKRGGVLQDEILKFTRLMLVQISQTALCNRLHPIEQRLARWLLACADRADTHKLQLTQEFLALMLGANRPTVTVAATMLQSANFIKYARGKITITNRKNLESFACACFETVKKEYEKANGEK